MQLECHSLTGYFDVQFFTSKVGPADSGSGLDRGTPLTKVNAVSTPRSLMRRPLIMLESLAYFEGYRHVLDGLQVGVCHCVVRGSLTHGCVGRLQRLSTRDANCTATHSTAAPVHPGRALHAVPHRQAHARDAAQVLAGGADGAGAHLRPGLPDHGGWPRTANCNH